LVWGSPHCLIAKVMFWPVGALREFPGRAPAPGELKGSGGLALVMAGPVPRLREPYQRSARAAGHPEAGGWPDNAKRGVGQGCLMVLILVVFCCAFSSSRWDPEPCRLRATVLSAHRRLSCTDHWGMQCLHALIAIDRGVPGFLGGMIRPALFGGPGAGSGELRDAGTSYPRGGVYGRDHESQSEGAAFRRERVPCFQGVRGWDWGRRRSRRHDTIEPVRVRRGFGIG
jgi:hypothetical protein